MSAEPDKIQAELRDTPKQETNFVHGYQQSGHKGLQGTGGRELFNFDKVYDLLIGNEIRPGSYYYALKSHGKPIVLAIGHSGAGKSTAINYLVGHKMQKNKAGRIIVCEDKTSLEIGHEPDPCTLHAQPVEAPGLPWMYVDCPGFQKTRAPEESTVESISIELVIRKAKYVQGILLFIEYSDITKARPEDTKELIHILKKLFIKPFDMLKSTTIVITKSEFIPLDTARETIVNNLLTLQSNYLAKAERYAQSGVTNRYHRTLSEEHSTLAECYKGLLEQVDNFIFLNPLDSGKSRDAIVNLLNKSTDLGSSYLSKNEEPLKTLASKVHFFGKTVLPTITIRDFDFTSYDSRRARFITLIYGLCGEMLELIQKIEFCTYKINEENDVIEHAKKSVEYADEFIQELEKLPDDIGGQVRQMQNSAQIFERHIRENHEKKSLIDTELKDISHQRSSCQQTIKKIDIAPDALWFSSAEFNKDAGLFGLFTWHSYKLRGETPSEDVAFTKIERNIKNGILINEKGGESHHFYEFEYVSEFRPRPAYVQIKGYIKANKHPGNKELISKASRDLSELEQREKELNKKKRELERENEVLRQNIQMARSNHSNPIEMRNKKLVEERREKERNEKIIEISKQARLESESIRNKLEIDFNTSREKNAFLIDLISTLNFDASIVSNFIMVYKSFIENQPLKKADNDRGNDRKNDSWIIIIKSKTRLSKNEILSHFAKNKKIPFSFKDSQGNECRLSYSDWLNGEGYFCLSQADDLKEDKTAQKLAFAKEENLEAKLKHLKEQHAVIQKEIDEKKKELTLLDGQIQWAENRIQQSKLELPSTKIKVFDEIQDVQTNNFHRARL